MCVNCTGSTGTIILSGNFILILGRYTYSVSLQRGDKPSLSQAVNDLFINAVGCCWLVSEFFLASISPIGSRQHVELMNTRTRLQVLHTPLISPDN